MISCKGGIERVWGGRARQREKSHSLPPRSPPFPYLRKQVQAFEKVLVLVPGPHPRFDPLKVAHLARERRPRPVVARLAPARRLARVQLAQHARLGQAAPGGAAPAGAGAAAGGGGGRVGEEVGELVQEVLVVAEEERHLVVHVGDRLLPLAVHIENLQKRLVHALVGREARLDLVDVRDRLVELHRLLRRRGGARGRVLGHLDLVARAGGGGGARSPAAPAAARPLPAPSSRPRAPPPPPIGPATAPAPRPRAMAGACPRPEAANAPRVHPLPAPHLRQERVEPQDELPVPHEQVFDALNDALGVDAAERGGGVGARLGARNRAPPRAAAGARRPAAARPPRDGARRPSRQVPDSGWSGRGARRAACGAPRAPRARRLPPAPPARSARAPPRTASRGRPTPPTPLPPAAHVCALNCFMISRNVSYTRRSPANRALTSRR